jgi:hypothetical protein
VEIKDEHSAYAVLGAYYVYRVIYGETKLGGTLNKEVRMLPLI